MVKMKIRKGDEVIVVAGKDKGKRGLVLAVMPKVSRVIVAGINLFKRHTKATKEHEGGIIQREASMHISNISHIDPQDGKATRVGFKILEDGTKVRVSKRSGETIDKGSK
ncbi:MAG: 50S ribosomal protein L24 [Pseudomonadota bacterium]